ncbi:MAG: hypothetical protein ACRDYW_02640, partial [Acidimicrobiales bacterium]
PADAARDELARAAAPRPARAPVKKATRAPAPAGPRPDAPDGGDAAATGAQSEPTAADDPPPADPVPVADAVLAPKPTKDTVADAPPAPEPRPAAAAPAGAPPTQADLTAAWPAVLDSVNKGARSMYNTGRFLDPDGGAAVFALENEPTRDQCEKHRPQVEAALGAHFGRPVPLRLVALRTPPAGNAVAAASTPSTPADATEEDEVVDVHALEDAPSAASGVDRLTEAFPGAQLVEEP